MMTVVQLRLLIDIEIFYFLPDDQQIADEGWFCRFKSKKLWNDLTASKIVTENTNKSQIRIFSRKMIEDISI